MSTAELNSIIDKLLISQAETDRQMKQTDLQIKEIGLQMQETNKETNKKIKALSELFTGQWGKLVEALVDSGLPKLFQSRGVAVRQIGRRHEIFDGKFKIAEIDVLLYNGGEDIAVEVKTTFRVQDVKDHLARLEKVRAAIPAYSTGEKKLYGAVAALKYDSEADLYAERHGLFVLKTSEGLFEITNRPDFQPIAA